MVFTLVKVCLLRISLFITNKEIIIIMYKEKFVEIGPQGKGRAYEKIFSPNKLYLICHNEEMANSYMTKTYFKKDKRYMIGEIRDCLYVSREKKIIHYYREIFISTYDRENLTCLYGNSLDGFYYYKHLLVEKNLFKFL